MEDVEYVFRQDIREKKSIGRGIYHKKNGSKSKKCTLPSDYLTRKEKNKMNSEVSNWSMQRLYPYAEFKQMPKDLQAEYVTGLVNKYNITVSVIAKELFNITDTCFRKYMLRENIYEKVPMRRGFRSSKESIDRFQTDILKSLGCEEPVKKEEPKPGEILISDPLQLATVNCKAPAMPIVPATYGSPTYSANLKACRLSMDGFDTETFEFLAKKYAGQNVSVTLLVEIKDSPIMDIGNKPAIGLTPIP